MESKKETTYTYKVEDSASRMVTTMKIIKTIYHLEMNLHIKTVIMLM